MYAIRSYYENDIPAPYNPAIETLPETGEARSVIFTMEKLDQAKTAFETEFIRSRITSYNVCYTKLLRYPLQHPQQWPQTRLLRRTSFLLP